jgi:MFS transporter, SP family, general alpha glucoside:H+ symporter
MTSQHDPEAERPRHMSVSQYEKDHEANNQGPPRRRSSIVAAEHSLAWTQNDGTLRKMSEAVPNLADLTKDARNAAESERTMPLWTALKLYPKAIAFSLGLSLAVVMEGYDTWLLGSFWGMTAFARKYGEPAGLVDGVQTYQVRAGWQTALGVATPLAQMVGLTINGFASERYGYRFTMIGALIAVTCFIFVTFFAVNIQMLLAGYVLCGLPW